MTTKEGTKNEMKIIRLQNNLQCEEGERKIVNTQFRADNIAQLNRNSSYSCSIMNIIIDFRKLI